MVSINNIEAYRNNDLYDTNSKSVIKTTGTDKTAGTDKAGHTESPTIKKDTVTLSKGVSVAQRREAMGLAPTGRLSRQDFETVVDTDDKTVAEALESAREKLGIDKDQKVSLSLNDKGKIVIKEKFTGKADLEKQLNNDKEFKATFNRLAANSEFLDFTMNLQTKTKSISLVSYMNGYSDDSDWNHLLELAETYEQLKSTKDPLATISMMSHQETPFKFVHNPEENTAG